MKLIPVNYYGFTAMDRRFSSPMLPWIVSEIKKRDYCEKLSLGVEDGVLQAYNQDFELQFSHKLWQITRFSQADQDPTTFLYLMRDDQDTLLYCYLFQAKKAADVLHIIDEILDPSISVQLKASALDFLQQYHRWNLRAYETVEIFRKKVQQYGKTDSFRKPGGHTFLIPIDQKIDNYRRDNIDNDIIDGHIIPNQVLFLRPTEKQFIFETQATSDRMYIVVAFLEENRKYYIKCYTVFGNSHRKNSETVVEIVHGNIPVTNGVVHLIQQPLAVKEHELKPFPYLPVLYKITADPELNFTYQIGERCGINKLLDNDTVIFTYFVSKDRGWGKYFSYSMDDFYDVLGRHLIVSTQRYTMNDLINLSSTTVNGTVLDTISGPVQLKFEEINGKFYVIWNQKKIRILRADYQCTNGIVHIVESPFCHIEEIIFDYLTINNRLVLPTTTVKPNFWSMLKDLID